MAGNLEKRVEQQVLRALLEKEAELDAALEQCHAQQQRPTLDSNDDEELERLREQRRRQLKTQQELQQQGMGTVEEIHDQKEFFELAKKFKNLVRDWPTSLLSGSQGPVRQASWLNFKAISTLSPFEECGLLRCSSSSDLPSLCWRISGRCSTTSPKSTSP